MGYQTNQAFYDGGNGRSYRSSGYQRQNFNAPYNTGRQTRQAKKHSGCKKGIYKNAKGETGTYISGWNYSKRLGLVKFYAVATKFSEVVTSKRGVEYTSLMVLVDIPFRPQIKVKGFVNKEGKCRIPSLGLVMNPSAPNGGYCGKSQKPKQQQNRY